jgi:DNA polymerase III sliding clamp (beta) subunit (PCNA family)
MLFSNRYEQAVRFVSSIISKKTSLQILTCVKITQRKESITFEASDLDTYIRVKLPLWTETEGEFAINSVSLLNMPKKYATGISDGRITFGNVRIIPLDAKEFPSLDTRFFNNPVWEQLYVSKHELTIAGKRLINYVSTDQSRISLTGICFRSGYLYATNGYYLLKYKTGLKSKDDTSFVISPVFLKLLSNEFVLDDGIDLSVYKPDEGCGYIVARGRSFEIVSKLISDEYPVVENILPSVMPHSFMIEREPFLQVIKQAIVFANKATSLADISLKNDNTEFAVTVKNRDNGIEFRDIVKVLKISGESWNGVSVNAKSLAGILSDCPSTNVLFKSGENTLSAITIESEHDDGMLFLLMPLRKIEDEEEDTSQSEDNKEKEQMPEDVKAA